jgi:predicted nuclease with RNAse H fold
MIGLAIGVDVAARRGCDVVALGPAGIAEPLGRVHTGAELAARLTEVSPAVVAIDAPSRWATAGRRACERALSARGLSVFTTPDAARGSTNSFYAWMRTGFAMFEGAAGYPTLETYPHAVAVALRGEVPGRALAARPAEKREWRRSALEVAGVDTSHLRTIDEVDAALCAVTGRWFLGGRTEALGDPADGVLTVPVGLPPGRVAAIRPRGTR